jgi:ribosome biogenesis GTPase
MTRTVEVDRLTTGRVFRKSLGQYFVSADGESVVCSISSTLRKQLVYPLADPSSLRHRVVAVEDVDVVDPVAIGDVAKFRDQGDGTGMIVQIEPRRNEFARRAPGKKPRRQVIVANVDQVVAVFAAAQPSPKWGLLDRYLVDAEAAGIPGVLCVTKMDLADGLIHEALVVYERVGYPVVATSAVTGQGLDGLRTALRGRMSVLVGKSGVGKTTLLNALQPGLGLRVAEVSMVTGKGKHTTSGLEMFELEFGGNVVDTPGMREFGLWDLDGTDVAELFPEMRPFLGLCRFGGGCSHTHEPGCAVKRAVERGGIAESRYQSYVKLAGQDRL